VTASIVITMAGFGSRFRAAGYTAPKYQIEAHGRTLFDWSMLSLEQFRRAGARFHFVLRKADEASGWVRSRCQALGIAEPGIHELKAPTDGQATTALIAGKHIGEEGHGFLIYNIDTFVNPRALGPGRIKGDGWIPVTDAPGGSWSFARADHDLRALELREKCRISPHATVGLYYFSSFALYRSLYDSFYADAARTEANERYVAPMYNLLIERGLDVFIEHVPFEDFRALGTPADLQSFLSASPPAIALS
jgi:NDP-sugar pyrophosphorylase family protein